MEKPKAVPAAEEPEHELVSEASEPDATPNVEGAQGMHHTC